MEAETGKIYRSSYKDKYGRPVLVMRPRCQVISGNPSNFVAVKLCI